MKNYMLSFSYCSVDEVDEVHDLTDKFSNDTNFDSIDAFQADYVSLKIHVSKTLTLVNVESILDKVVNFVFICLALSI